MDFGDNDDSGLTWAWAPMIERNYALAGFDRTHNFQLFSNYALPFGPGQRYLVARRRRRRSPAAGS